MRFAWLFASVLSLGLLMGCQARPGASARAAATPGDLQALRRGYQQVDPTALIGVVSAVRPEDHLAAVTDVPLEQFKPGDVVTFLDSRQNVIGTGTVVVVTSNALHVRYAAGAQRAPQVGDLMVRVR